MTGTRVYHLARFIANDDSGSVSAWCSKQPKPIDMKKATWTNRIEAATCKACISAKQKHDTEKGVTE